MQVFKLPRPVLCVGGILQVELLGRVQTQEMDQLYYIWYLCIQFFFFFFTKHCPVICIVPLRSLLCANYTCALLPALGTGC